MSQTTTLHPLFGQKHKDYIRRATTATISVAEGAVRAGKTIDNIAAFAWLIQNGTPDRIHLATGSTSANAKLNIGDANGFGLEYIFRGRCRWSKYRGNESLIITIKKREYVVIFAGGSKADSFKKIRGNSYGMWIATEINLHHDNTIKEAFNRQLAAKNRRIFWDLNPESPNSTIYTEYIDKFAEQFGSLYNYEHFTIKDNATISAEQLRIIENQYTPGTVWYRRDILGERCTAEGLIYPLFADKPSRYETTVDQLPNFRYITVGVDFGGNKSAHAFVATGITHDWTPIALRSLRIPAKGVSVETMITRFTLFCEGVESDCGPIEYVYADSAEQAIINSLDAQTRWRILGSVKGEIIDRIRAMDQLLSSDRFKYIAGQCDSLVKALCDAVWDDKKLEDVRLDDGTSDIDTLDAWEYSWSAFIRQIVRR